MTIQTSEIDPSLPTDLRDQLHDVDFDDFKKSAQCIEMEEETGRKVIAEEDPDLVGPSKTRVLGDCNPKATVEVMEMIQDVGTLSVSDGDTTESLNSHAQIEKATMNKAKYATPKDFELLTVIGVGAFGRVLQVRSKRSKKIYAMKVISKRLLRRKNSYVRQMKLERDILKKIRHPFVVTMHCSFQTKEKLFIVMDFLAGGELFLRLGREGIFLEDQAAFYLAEIILALEHLHNNNILHRDLKPENVLLSADGHICLTDFGLAKDFSVEQGYWSEAAEGCDDSTNPDTSQGAPLHRAKTICGTTEYMAPEMIAKKGYGKAADFWSLGCIAYEMLSGNTPFHSKLGERDILRKILSEKVKMPQGLSSGACKLLKGLLNRNPQDRFGAARSTMFQIGGVAGLKQMEFFSFVDWAKIERKEIDPPTRFAVEGDIDLRHFHDEFKRMDIPPSVIKMTKENFQPRRCASNHFRGFSFIQDDFLLPDRDEEEFEKYWNSTDPDGESASELSAGVLSDCDQLVGAPDKKKRPPRKKKKKKDEGDRKSVV